MLSNIYRFTPPTCTLEIKGKKSFLSRWQNQDLLKKIRFQLSFDDPRLPSFEQVTIKGDRQDLEQLKTVVDSYVEYLLQTSFLEKNSSQKNDRVNNQPLLRSQGLTNHELFFGSLNHDSEQNKIILSTVQLFDLVTALEAYCSKNSLLQKSDRDQFKSLIPLWGVLAAGFIVAVGIASLLIKNSSAPNVASSPESESSTPIPQLDEVIPPPIPERSSRPNPKPNKSISSTKRLPPPPAVDTPKPKPNIPDPADYPLSNVARQSGLERQQQTESKIIITEQISSKPANSNLDRGENKDIVIPNIAPETNLKSEQELAQSNNFTLDSANIKPESIAKISERKLELTQQIQTYFLEKWQPPADLKQSLEYRLYLNANGSIEKVIPIGKAAKLYLSQTKIPVRGEAFVSPSAKSQSSAIRLLLNPDGGVKVLEE